MQPTVLGGLATRSRRVAILLGLIVGGVACEETTPTPPGVTTLATDSSREPPAFGPWFVDRAADFGLDIVTRCGDPAKRCVLDSLGTGVALFDVDGDGDLDLFVAPGSAVRDGAIRSAGGPWLFRNDGPGRWTDITAESRLRHTGWAQGVAVADYDADGDLDLFVAQYGRDTLWQNQGAGVFRDVTGEAGISGSYWGVSATWGDTDGDGWLDLYVTNYLEVDPLDPPPPNDYLPGHPVFQGPATLPGQPDQLWRNRGDGTFEDVTTTAGLDRLGNKGMSALLMDLDADGRLDLYVTNDTHGNELFRGLEGGRFEEIGLLAGVAYDPRGIAEGSMGIAVADIDGDGSLDLAHSNFRQEGTRIFGNLGGQRYRDLSGSMRFWDLTAEFVGWGVALADLDHDGWPDLVQGNGHVYPDVPDARYDQSMIVLRNRDGRAFEDVTHRWGPRLADCVSGRALAVGDLDGDGDLDLVFTTIDGPLRVLVNEGRPAGAAVTIRLAGRPPNLEAVGARVTIVAGGRSQLFVVHRGGSLLSASDATPHFGLGDATVIDAVEVRWPDGSTSRFEDLPVDASLSIRQNAPDVSVAPFQKDERGGRQRAKGGQNHNEL